MAEEQVAGGLGRPVAGRVCGDAGVEHLAGGDVDEEQDVVAAEQGCVDGEEVAGHGGLGVEELRPGGVGSFRCWIDAAGFEDLSDGGGGDLLAETCEFAVDAAVAPSRILGGEAEDESSDRIRGWRSSWSSAGLCPVTGDAATVPSEQSVRGDDPGVPSWAGERGGEGAQQRPVVVVDGGSVDLASQD